MTLEDRLEKAFPGIRFCQGAKIEEARQRQRVIVEVPVMARLSREGTVALGDVYSDCVALGGLVLPGRPSLRVSILVLDAEGGVSVVDCTPRTKGVHAEGARKLSQIARRLAKIGSTGELEALYQKSCGKKRRKESLVDLALSHWEEAASATVQRARDGWLETMAAGRMALYLAMDRKPGDKPSTPADPITPMQKLLEERPGGIFQVLQPVTKTKPQKKYLESLEEPARIIWVYRRLIRS